MKYNPLIASTVLVLSLSLVGAASATDVHRWSDHATPFTFLFGNEIDSHQQSRVTRSGALRG